jgi:predicted kinase
VRLSTDEWQADLGVGHAETDFHGRLQGALYRHGLALLRHGVNVILEDGLWTTDERTAKFTDARACSARIELHVFNVGYDTLWDRLRRRNEQAQSADYPMTEAELRSAWSVFQPLSATELTEVDFYAMHAGGLD